jgi:cytochrome c peroxidase
MSPTRSAVRLTLGILALAAAVLVLLNVISAGAPAATEGDPHATARIDSSHVRRVLAATERAGTATSRAELVSEGRALFESATLAKSGESCGGCHTVGTANGALGLTPHADASGKVLFGRDPPSLIGVAKTEPYGWVGDVPTLQQMVVNTILSHFTDGATQPPAKTAEQAAALVAYVSQLRAPISRFDQGTMTPAALRGEVLFQGKGACIACHGGPLFTDNALHNTLVPNRSGWSDAGATFPPGAFNTPELRDVANSGPYMHNGVFTTLREVVEFYNARSSVSPLLLTPGEVDDLVAYLESL